MLPLPLPWDAAPFSSTTPSSTPWEYNVTVTSNAELTSALSTITEAIASAYSDEAVSSYAAYITFAGTQTVYTLASTYAYEALSATWSITLDARNVTAAEGVTVAAAAGSPHFYLSKIAFAAYGITFTGGTSSSGGGSIYALEGSLTLTDVAFVENHDTTAWTSEVVMLGTGGECTEKPI